MNLASLLAAAERVLPAEAAGPVPTAIGGEDDNEGDR